MNRSEQVYNMEDVGRAFKTIANRLKSVPTLPLEKIEAYGCLVCRHFWSKETYDYQRGCGILESTDVKNNLTKV